MFYLQKKQAAKNTGRLLTIHTSALHNRCQKRVQNVLHLYWPASAVQPQLAAGSPQAAAVLGWDVWASNQSCPLPRRGAAKESKQQTAALSSGTPAENRSCLPLRRGAASDGGAPAVQRR